MSQPVYPSNWQQQWSQGVGNFAPSYGFSQYGGYGSGRGSWQGGGSMPVGGSTPGGGSSTNQSVNDFENDGDDYDDDDDAEEDVDAEGEQAFPVSQTQQTFTDLLNQNQFVSGGLCSNQQMMEPRGAKSWSLLENKALISAYMNVSCDEITGTDQRGGRFWSRIVAKYEETRAANPSMPYRTPASLRSRWGRLTESIMKWIGCHENQKRRRASGETDDDVLKNTHKQYENDYGGKFLSEQAWKQLDKFPKWEEIVCKSYRELQKGKSATAPDAGSDSSGKRLREDSDIGAGFGGSLGFNNERPMGTKKAKAIARGRGKAPIIDDNLQQLYAEMHISNEGRMINQQLERERLAMLEKKEARKQKQMEIEERRANWEILKDLKANPNRIAIEDELLADIEEWFRVNRPRR